VGRILVRTPGKKIVGKLFLANTRQYSSMVRWALKGDLITGSAAPSQQSSLANKRKVTQLRTRKIRKVSIPPDQLREEFVWGKKIRLCGCCGSR